MSGEKLRLKSRDVACVARPICNQRDQTVVAQLSRRPIAMISAGRPHPPADAAAESDRWVAAASVEARWRSFALRTTVKRGWPGAYSQTIYLDFPEA